MQDNARRNPGVFHFYRKKENRHKVKWYLPETEAEHMVE